MYFTSLIYLLIYVSLWIILFVKRQKKVKYFGVGSFIVLLYTIIGIISCFEYNSINYTELQLFPFLYLFTAIIIASMPILKYNENFISKIQLPNKNIIDFLSYVYIVCTIILLPTLFGDFRYGLNNLFLSREGGQELYYELNNVVVKNVHNDGISNIFMVIFNIFADIIIFIFFYYLAFRTNKIIIIALGIAILLNTTYSIVQGSRTGITMRFLSIVVGFITMKKIIPKEIKNKFIRIGVIFGGIIILLISIMTISRFSNDSDFDNNPFKSVINYLGQCNLNFNENALNAGGIRNGDRTASKFKYYLGYDNVPVSSIPLRIKHVKLKMNDEIFSTFVGDFVLDYGPIVTLIIFCFFSFLFCRLTKIRNGKIFFHQIFMLYFATLICTHGSFYLFYYSFNANHIIIAFLIMYFIFKFDGTYYSKNNVWQL